MSGCAATTSATDDEPKFTIGFSVPVLASPFWKTEADFMKHVAEELGGELIVADANQDESKQLQIMETFVSQGVDGIIAASVTDALAPALIKVTDRAGIPLVFAERTPGFEPDAAKYPSYLGFVGADSHQGAMLTAQALYDAGSRKIVATTGTKGSSVAEQRVAGLLDFAKEHQDFEVLQVQYGVELEQEGITAAQNYLSAFPGPGFDGYWSFADGGAVGAAAALDQAGESGTVNITGFDAEAAGSAGIAAGDILAAAGGQFIDGGFAYIMLWDYLNGNKPKEPYVVMDYLLVNSDNIDEYIKQFGSGLPPYDIKAMSSTLNPKASTADFKIEIQP
jgi:inositol transport system substrate-binding protein